MNDLIVRTAIMHRIVLLLTCLTCTSYARQALAAVAKLQRIPLVESRALARLLLAANLTSAFNPVAQRGRTSRLDYDFSHHVAVVGRNRVGHPVGMSDALEDMTYEKVYELDAKALDDLVEELQVHADAAEEKQNAPHTKVSQLLAVTRTISADVEVAKKHAATALANGEPDAEMHYILGYAAECQGDDDTALEEYDKAIDLDQMHWRAFFRAGNVALNNNVHESAYEYFETVQEIKPDHKPTKMFFDNLRKKGIHEIHEYTQARMFGPDDISSEFKEPPDAEFPIHEHGYWMNMSAHDISTLHAFDSGLAGALEEFFEDEAADMNVESLTIADLGCGKGDYVARLCEAGMNASGFDGNPDTPAITKGLGSVLDLSSPKDILGAGKTFDWVMSLETAEHLPVEYEDAFIDNLHRNNAKGVVLSWAWEGHGGYGHFNERNNGYVKYRMSKLGYENDIAAETALRVQSHLGWFRDTVMVFRKPT